MGNNRRDASHISFQEHNSRYMARAILSSSRRDSRTMLRSIRLPSRQGEPARNRRARMAARSICLVPKATPGAEEREAHASGAGV